MKYSKIELAKEAFKHKGFIGKIPVIVRMVKSIFAKDGYKPEMKNIAIPGAVLVYLVSPVNLSFEWIPFLGQIDDLALLALAIPLLMKEAEKFVAWEAQTANGQKIEEAQIIN